MGTPENSEYAVRSDHVAGSDVKDRIVIAFVIAVGLVMGSAIVLYVNPQPPPGPSQVREVEYLPAEIVLTPYVTESLRLQGWTSAGLHGYWLSDTRGSLDLPARAVSSNGVALIFGAMIKLKGAYPDPPKPIGTIKVLMNSVEVGTWPLWADVPYPARRFVVPRGILKEGSSNALQFVREDDGAKTPWRLSFGLLDIKIENGADRKAFNSSLDTCTGSSITGWAVSEGSPIPVDVYIDGVRQSTIQTPVYRPDLKTAGLPPEAGFSIQLTDPPSAGTEVKVAYAGHPDRYIGGSPCRF